MTCMCGWTCMCGTCPSCKPLPAFGKTEQTARFALFRNKRGKVSLIPYSQYEYCKAFVTLLGTQTITIREGDNG